MADIVKVSAQDRDIVVDQANKEAGPPWVFNDWHGRAQDIIADQASTEAGPPWVFNDWHGRAQDIIADQASTELPKVDDTILVAVCA